jgi:hypothetical protein
MTRKTGLLELKVPAESERRLDQGCTVVLLLLPFCDERCQLLNELLVLSLEV